MRSTIFLLVFLISGVCFSQNPDPFWDGIRTKLVQPDTLSTFDRDALTPKLGTILYHKDTGVSRWEKWDGTAWVPFGESVEWGNITGTLSDQTDLQSALDSKLSRNINETTTGSLTFESGSDNLRVQFNGVIFNRGLSYLNATVNTQSLRIGGLTGTNWNEIQLNSENGVTANSTVSGSDPVNDDDFVTKGYAESNFATVESGTFDPVVIDSGGGATYSHSGSGDYMKVGDRVFFSVGVFAIASTGTASGELRVDLSDIPYGVNKESMISVGRFGGFATSWISLFGRAIPSSDYVGIYYKSAASTGSPNVYPASTATAGQIFINGFYITND